MKLPFGLTFYNVGPRGFALLVTRQTKTNRARYDSKIFGMRLTTRNALGYLAAWHVVARVLGAIGFWKNNRILTIEKDAEAPSDASRDVGLDYAAAADRAESAQTYETDKLGKVLKQTDRQQKGGGARTFHNVLMFTDVYATCSYLLLGAHLADRYMTECWRGLSFWCYLLALRRAGNY